MCIHNGVYQSEMHAHTNSDDIGRDLMMRHFDIRYTYMGFLAPVIVAIPIRPHSRTHDMRKLIRIRSTQNKQVAPPGNILNVYNTWD